MGFLIIIPSGIIVFLLNRYLCRFKKFSVLLGADLVISILVYLTLICFEISIYGDNSAHGGFIRPGTLFYFEWFLVNIFISICAAMSIAKDDLEKSLSITLAVLIFLTNILLPTKSIDALYNRWTIHYVEYRFKHWGSNDIPKVLGVNHIIKGISYETELRKFLKGNREGYKSLTSVEDKDVTDESLLKDTVSIGCIFNADTEKYQPAFYRYKEYFYIEKDNRYILVNIRDIVSGVVKQKWNTMGIMPGVDMTSKNEDEITIVVSLDHKDLFFKPIIKNGNIFLEELQRNRIDKTYWYDITYDENGEGH